MIRPWEDKLVKLIVVLSVVLLILEIDLESTGAETAQINSLFHWLELTIASVFTLEIVFRFVDAVKRPAHESMAIDGYEHGTFHHAAASGFHKPAGLKAHLCSVEFWIDLLAVVPYWLIYFTPASWFGVLRALRILRLLKLYRYSSVSHRIVVEFINRKTQIAVLTWIVLSVALLGSVGIYELEHAAQPKAFGTVSDSMWWMIVTMTTVGYGDVSPHTPEGKLFAMALMPFSLGIMGAVLGVVGGVFQDVCTTDEKAA